MCISRQFSTSNVMVHFPASMVRSGPGAYSPGNFLYQKSERKWGGSGQLKNSPGYAPEFLSFYYKMHNRFAMPLHWSTLQVRVREFAYQYLGAVARRRTGAVSLFS